MIVVFFTNTTFAGEITTAWELVKDKNGIKVFTREIAGSQLKEFKGITQIKTSLESLIALYYDRASSPQWIFACEYSKVLKEISLTEKYIYAESWAPWPVSHRDIIIHSVLTQNPDTKEVLITEVGISDYIPENSDFVRVPEMKGYYKFTLLNDGAVEVIYQSHSNPGGRLPKFLVNVAVVDNPFDTLSKMKEIVQKDKYQQARFDFLK
ncbi:START domain-containing protein [candidate division KSB1 bacterium]|nr:START domain-containing protein [candidate division KSB1 bacterium]